MIVLILAIVGAVSGVIIARKRGGQRLDLVQYATVLAIAGALTGLFLSIFLSRLL